jgi:hypothetical protein
MNTGVSRPLVFTFAAFLSAMTSGCIYIPVPLQPVEAKEPMLPNLLGSENSDHPIRVGVAKSKVLSILGVPYAETTDGKDLAYLYSYLTGYWVGLIIRISDGKEPPFDVPRYRHYTAILTFDRNERLSGYQLRWSSDAAVGSYLMNDFMDMSGGKEWKPRPTSDPVQHRLE